MDLQLKDHVAIVTGAARGIGAAVARSLATEGAAVVVWDLELEAAEALTREIVQEGGRAQAAQGDVTSRLDVERVIESVNSSFGGIQILVNNAGFSLDAPLTEMTDERWDKVNDVCLKGTFLTCRAVVPHLISQGYGRIINISSRAYNGDDNKSNYSAAKAGVIGFTRALAIELGRHAITANIVAPGLIRTDRVRQTPFFDELDQRARQLTPIQRPGSPADVADAVLYLASPRTGFVSGEVLHVTGGRR